MRGGGRAGVCPGKKRAEWGTSAETLFLPASTSSRPLIHLSTTHTHTLPPAAESEELSARVAALEEAASDLEVELRDLKAEHAQVGGGRTPACFRSLAAALPRLSHIHTPSNLGPTITNRQKQNRRKPKPPGRGHAGLPRQRPGRDPRRADGPQGRQGGGGRRAGGAQVGAPGGFGRRWLCMCVCGLWW
jgi:hypothetical protein